MDKMREEFEVWACNYNLKIADCGNYADRHVNNMWKAWQASRSALVVELPGAIWCSLAYHEAINDVKEALDDAGVGHK